MMRQADFYLLFLFVFISLHLRIFSYLSSFV